MNDIYQERGYKDREDYLVSLAEEYGIGTEIIKSVADVLGEDEDFDGLIATLYECEG